MAKVYVVQDGEYSSRHIVGIFTDRSAADAEARLWPDSGDIEEWELDVVTDHPVGCLRYHVAIKPDGNYAWARTMSPCFDDIPEGALKYNTYTDNLSGYIWAKDEKHAIKIANERRVQMIASGELERLRTADAR